MTLINTSTTTPIKTFTSKADAPEKHQSNEVKATATSTTHLSDQALLLSSLYDAASKYIIEEHMEPFSGYVNGKPTHDAYLNTGKYNDYLFDKAAASMVEQAKEQGITLDKKDVIAQLKSDNSAIADLQLNNQERTSLLGSRSALYHLTDSEMDALTDMYISAKENGLDLDQVGILAMMTGLHHTQDDDAETAVIRPLDRTIYPGSTHDPIAPLDSILDKASEIRGKLQGDLGLGEGFVSYLLNSQGGLSFATDDSLNFLSRLIDIQNQRKPEA